MHSAIINCNAVVGIIGLGYVGLPLASATAKAGYKSIGFDVDGSKIQSLNDGHSYIDAVSNEELSSHREKELFEASDDFSRLAECDVIIICVPTPLSKNRDPDLRYVIETTRTIARTLKLGQLIVLESTTYPGTSDEVVKPILEAGGLKSAQDFWIGYSPEREDPGNVQFNTAVIPKVISGDGEDAADLMEAFYSRVVSKVVRVSSLAVGEAVKITENIFRAVNIALVNELKVLYDAMGIDVWEVIDAASTKPFGYMPFYPGPGLGGHCIPIDPFYLTWKAREYGLSTKFVELAGEINVSMPSHVISKLEKALDEFTGKSLGKSKILILGMAYKKNVSDVRESPSLFIMETLLQRGAIVDFHDDHVAVVPPTRSHQALSEHKSVPLTKEALIGYDAVLILTDHDNIDYSVVVENAALIVDTRNAIRKRQLQHRALVLA
ncbi:MAG: nucleotide sugar dehydrogenase [Salaquimonas sp.]